MQLKSPLPAHLEHPDAARLCLRLSALALGAAPARAEQTLERLMGILLDALDALRYSVVVSARLRDYEKKRSTAAPVALWHPVEVIFDPREPTERIAFLKRWIAAGDYLNDPSTRALVARAGEERVLLARSTYGDEGPPATTRELLENYGAADRLIAGTPLRADREVFFIFDRGEDAARFDDEDVRTLRAALPVLRTVARQVCRIFGWVGASEPLTQRERELLCLLLEGLTEKECAERLSLRASSTHQLVVRIFRKFDVRARAELMALWLQHEASPTLF